MSVSDDEPIAESSSSTASGAVESEPSSAPQPAREPSQPTEPAKRPVSPQWQKDCKRNGAGIIAVFVAAGLAWLTGSHTLVPLSNGRVVQPSLFGWPFYLCIAGALAGCWVYWAADHNYMPILGRRYVPVDRSAKYSLTFNEIKIGWFLEPSKSVSGPDPLNVRIAIAIGNGLTIPIQAYIERMDVKVNGKAPNAPIGGVRKLRLLPGQIREYRAPLVLDISTGSVGGEVDYSIIYSSLNGIPAYRRTHKFAFGVNEPITLQGLRSGKSGSTDYTELENERDEDMPEDFNMNTVYP
jgi:hypothetical protein